MNRSKRSKWVLIIPIGLALLVILEVTLYQKKTLEYGNTEAVQILSNTASEQAKLFLAVLDGKYAVLETFAHVLNDQPEWEQADLMRRMNGIVRSMNFFVMAYTDVQGDAVYHDGRSANIADRAYFVRSIAGERALERIETPRLADDPRFIISVPLLHQGEKRGILCASFTTKDFQALLVPRYLEQKGFAFIADKSGSVIVDCDCMSSTSMPVGFNLLGQPNTGFMSSADSIRLASDLASGKGGMVKYRVNDQNWYGVYEPLQVNDWMLFSTVPESVALERLVKYRNHGLMVIGAVVLAAVLLVTYVILLDRRWLKKLEQEKQELKESRRALQANQKLYRAVEEFSDNILFEGNLRTGELWFNHSYERVYGRKPSFNTIEGLKQPNSVVLPEDMDLYNAVGEQIMAGIAMGSAEYRVRKSDDTVVWHRLEYKLVYDNEGDACGVVGKITSVDEHKRREEQLTQIATRDGMTGLLQHDAAMEQAELYLSGEGAEGCHALFVFDLDNFKRANDTFGHQMGDKVLVAAAAELRSSFRTGDIVGRIGGDEFMVLQKNIPSKKLVQVKAVELCERLQFVQEKGDANVHVTCCVGISIYQGDQKSFGTLFREADSALYDAKERGKHTYAIFGGNGVAEKTEVPKSTGSFHGENTTVQLHTLLQHMDGAVLLLEIGDTIDVRYTSPGYNRMVFGGARAENPCSVEKMEHIHPGDKSRLYAALREGAKTGQPVQVTYRCFNQAGEYSWHQMRGAKTTQSGLDKPLLLVVVTDVTELKLQEKGLSAQNQRLIEVLKQTGLRVWELEPEKKLFHLWDAGFRDTTNAETVFEDAPESVLKSGYVHPNSAEALEDLCRRIEAGEPEGHCMVFCRRYPDGDSFGWYRLSYHMQYDEKGTGEKALGILEPCPDKPKLYDYAKDAPASKD